MTKITFVATITTWTGKITSTLIMSPGMTMTTTTTKATMMTTKKTTTETRTTTITDSRRRTGWKTRFPLEKKEAFFEEKEFFPLKKVKTK